MGEGIRLISVIRGRFRRLSLRSALARQYIVRRELSRSLRSEAICSVNRQIQCKIVSRNKFSCSTAHPSHSSTTHRNVDIINHRPTKSKNPTRRQRPSNSHFHSLLSSDSSDRLLLSQRLIEIFQLTEVRYLVLSARGRELMFRKFGVVYALLSERISVISP